MPASDTQPSLSRAIVDAIVSFGVKPAQLTEKNPANFPTKKRFWTVFCRATGHSLRVVLIMVPSPHTNADFGERREVNIRSLTRSLKGERLVRALVDVIREAAELFEPGPKARAIPFFLEAPGLEKPIVCSAAISNKQRTHAALEGSSDGTVILMREDDIAFIDIENDFGALRRVPWQTIKALEIDEGVSLPRFRLSAGSKTFELVLFDYRNPGFMMDAARTLAAKRMRALATRST